MLFTSRPPEDNIRTNKIVGPRLNGDIIPACFSNQCPNEDYVHGQSEWYSAFRALRSLNSTCTHQKEKCCTKRACGINTPLYTTYPERPHFLFTLELAVPASAGKTDFLKLILFCRTGFEWSKVVTLWQPLTSVKKHENTSLWGKFLLRCGPLLPR